MMYFGNKKNSEGMKVDEKCTVVQIIKHNGFKQC